jgi:hypothetical protein
MHRAWQPEYNDSVGAHQRTHFLTLVRRQSFFLFKDPAWGGKKGNGVDGVDGGGGGGGPPGGGRDIN